MEQNRTKLYAIIAVVVVFGLVAVYAATAKTTTTNTIGPNTQTHGGAGTLILGWLGL